MIRAMIVLANLLENGFQGFLAGIPGTSPYAVTHNTTPRAYLDEKKFPRWYQRLLFRYDRITVAVKPLNGDPGDLEPVLDSSMPLPRGSLIRVDETLSDDEYTMMFEEAREGARDYVLDTEKTDPDDSDYVDPFLNMVSAFHGLSGAYVFGGKDEPTTLQEFIRLVGHSDIAETPPRNLIVSTHAHWSGQLDFAPTSSAVDAGQSFTYEDIGRLAAELKLDDKYLEPRSPKNKPSLLIFTGCAFGQSEPFLRKLRDTINPRLAVVAPLYFYGIGRKKNEERILFEYMSKPYTIYSKAALSRDELISKLKLKNFRDVYQVPIKDREWDGWVPFEPWEERWIERPPTVLWYSKFKVPLQSVPVSVDRLTFEQAPERHFKNGIATLGADSTHMLSAAYPFPWWKRFGFDDANKMVDELSWRYQFNEDQSEGNTVDAIASAHRYSVLVPIVEKSSKPYAQRRLLWNLYDLRSGGPGREPIIEDLPLPKFPLRPSTDPRKPRFWNAIEPSA